MASLASLHASYISLMTTFFFSLTLFINIISVAYRQIFCDMFIICTALCIYSFAYNIWHRYLVRFRYLDRTNCYFLIFYAQSTVW